MVWRALYARKAASSQNLQAGRNEMFLRSYTKPTHSRHSLGLVVVQPYQFEMLLQPEEQFGHPSPPIDLRCHVRGGQVLTG